jgi:branched-chain amino acid transport system permease protein
VAWVRLLGLCLLVLLASCSRLDVEQARLCERLIPAIEAPGAPFEIIAREKEGSARHAVRIRYRGADGAERWLSCRFAGGGLEQDRLRLIGAATDREGELSEVQVYLLRTFWLGLYEGQARGAEDRAAEGEGERPLLYLLQLALNGLALGGIYGLIAIGYTLVYGIIGRINLAFGDFAMVGASITFIGVTLIALTGAGPLPLALCLLLLVIAGAGAVQGFVTERMIFRPLRQTSSQAPLIATLGLAIVLQEGVRLLQGAQERWVQPVFSAAHTLASGEGFRVTVSSSQVVSLLLAAALYLLLARLMRRSRFGRAARACADDVAMAALCGVNVDRVVAQTFMLASAYAGIAGFVLLLRYGSMSFHDGLVIGFKGLTAAVLGGIGSVPGAMLGGFLIGGLETFWAGYLAMAYKDVAVFALLALMLILRPSGLLGLPARLANDAFRREPA